MKMYNIFYPSMKKYNLIYPVIPKNIFYVYHLITTIIGILALKSHLGSQNKEVYTLAATIFNDYCYVNLHSSLFLYLFLYAFSCILGQYFIIFNILVLVWLYESIVQKNSIAAKYHFLFIKI